VTWPSSRCQRQTHAICYLKTDQACSYLILLSRQGKVVSSRAPSPTAVLGYVCANGAWLPRDLQNGSRLCLRKKKRKSSKMCRSLYCRDGHACATSSSTKVRGLLRNASTHPACADEMPSLLDSKVVYRRYASLFFIAGCASTDNELITLEIVHRYVEQMDKYYGNVCELDIIFNFQKAYFILDELLLAGELQESSKKNVLRCISQEDSLEDMEVSGKGFNLLAAETHPYLGFCHLPYSPEHPGPFQTNSMRLPFRSRKRSPKLDECQAQKGHLHPLGAHLA